MRKLKENIRLMIRFAGISLQISKGYAGLVMLSSFLAIVLNYNVIIMPKFFIDELTGEKRTEVLIQYLLIFVAIGLCTRLVSNYVEKKKALEQYKLSKGLQLKLNQSIMSVAFERTESAEILDLHEHVMGAIKLRNLHVRMINIMSSFVVFSFELVSSAVLISFLNPLIIAVLAAIVLFNSVFSRNLQKINLQSERVFSRFNRNVNYFKTFSTDFAIGKDARIYAVDEVLTQEYDKFNAKSFRVNMDVMKKSGAFYGLMSINEQIQMLVAYLYVAWKVIAGAIGIGDFSMYVGAANQMGTALYNFANNITEYKLIREYVQEYMELLTMGDEDTSVSQGAAVKDLEEPITIEFRNVSFRYPQAKDFALQSINLVLHPGEKLAVVGKNGAGKTTFIKLMCGLYQPTSGEILINGLPIQSLSSSQYLQYFSVLFQDYKLFAASVSENIGFDGADPQQVQSALMRSDIYDRIMELDRGMDTEIFKIFDEEGIEFSGGEGQKIAIARAIYKDAPVMILDEPTAALDPYAEYDFFSRIQEICKQKTAVLISHRMAGCRLCDKIAVFDAGRLVQYGTHAQLVEQKDSLYQTLYNAQADYYVTVK